MSRFGASSVRASVLSLTAKVRVYERWLSLQRRVPAFFADGPWRLDRRGWLASVTRTLRGAADDDYGMAASAIAFSSFLALLPLLGAVALVYGMLTPPERVVENVRALIFILPEDARRFIGNWLVETITRREGRGIGLVVAVGIALLSASRAGRSIMSGLNLASDADHRRGFLRRRFVALIIVLCGAALMLGALLAISAFAWIERMLPTGLTAILPTLRFAFWTVAGLSAAIVLAIMYRSAPNRPPPQWRWVVPGALAATLIWLAATSAFGFYLGNFGQTTRTYGSIGAIVVLQLWLFASSFVLLLGAKLNTELMRSAGMEPQAPEHSSGR